MNKEKEILLSDIKSIVRSWFLYLIYKWRIFAIVGIIFASMGVLYAWLEKPVYTAELSFTSENESGSNLSAYAGIAAQFGLDLGGSSGSAFAGENLMQLMVSRKLIEKTLLTTVKISDSSILLINYYLKKSGLGDALKEKFKGESFIFTSEVQESDRKHDSVIQKICSDIGQSLDIQKRDKKSDIISVAFRNEDELFAKLFVEELVNTVILYYTDYKIKKVRQNVAILQHQTDSVRNLINGNIVDIAVSSDLNVNPTRQIVRTGIQRKQLDAQVNGALYTELVKNLELSKLSLRKETPLIQIIDTPMFPLKKKKMGRLMAGIEFAFLGAFLTFCYYFIKKIFE